MKRNIDEFVGEIIRDNEEFIKESCCTSIAQYIILSAESSGNWWEFFDKDEYEENPDLEPTSEQVDELKDYLNKYYSYLPDYCGVKEMIQAAEYQLTQSQYKSIEIVKEVPLSEDATLYIWRGNYDTDYPTETACIVNSGRYFRARTAFPVLMLCKK